MNDLCCDMHQFIWKLCPLVSLVCRETILMNAHQHKAAQSAFFNWYVTTQLYKKQHDMFALKFKCVVISSRLQINNNAHTCISKLESMMLSAFTITHCNLDCFLNLQTALLMCFTFAMLCRILHVLLGD